MSEASATYEVHPVLSREAWLAERRKAIGASDLAAVLGVSPFVSPWEVWAEKRGLLEPWGGNEATTLGQHFERAVLDFAEDQLGGLYRNKRIVHESLPMASTCDAMTLENRPVEAKTTGLAGPVFGSWGEALTDEVPEYYLVQLHAQLMCSKADLAYLFSLIPGRGIVEFHAQPNEKLHDRIGNIVSDWWEKHIVQGVEPSRESVALDVVKRLKRVPSKQIHFGIEEQERIDAMETLKAQCKSTEVQIDELKKSLLFSLGDAESAICFDGREMTYFEQTRKASVSKETKFRVMRFRKNSK